VAFDVARDQVVGKGAVAGDFRETDHIGGGDDLFKGLGHADREVLEIKHL